MYDICIIGGGPAGMMAAARAAELGTSKKLKVILLEKNPGLGKKLLITGGGRCNVTNAQFDIRKFLAKYKDSDKFLFSAFSQFDVKKALAFFNDRQMQTKVEAENRVFPVSDSAQSVWNVLVEYLKTSNVEIKTNATVSKIEHKDGKITGVILKNKEIIRAKKYILATGGTSRPETGSTGEGFTWLKELGHNVIPSNEALVPIALKVATQDAWVKVLSGVSLRD